MRAGRVNSAKDWLWSFHREAIGERSHLLVDEIPIELPQDWNRADGDIKPPLVPKYFGILFLPPVSSMTFSNGVKELGLESTPRPRGRLRKRVGKE